MNRQAPSPTPNREDIYRLANAALCGEMSQAESTELEALVANDPAVRRWYLEFICDACNLRARAQSRQAADMPVIVLGDLELDGGIEPFAPPPTAGLFGGMVRGTAGYFSNAGPLSYLIATVVMLVMGVVAWNWKLPDHVQVVEQTAPSFETKSGIAGQVRFVGRVTGLVDCNYVDESTAIFAGANVPLGRKYALASGLMEITYNSGAKVILEGPCTYEVESATGGYLSVGKLTARVEKRGPDTRLSTLNAQLFAVRTPTATVTDLGTEFGVEVDKHGATTSHVFRGSIRVQMVGDADEAGSNGRVLHENESVRIERHDASNQLVILSTSASPDFVRDLPDRKTKTFDLVDALAGGNGHSGQRRVGIVPTDGRVLIHPSPNPADALLTGDHKYHRVKGLPFVDGVFIPDGSEGPVQTDSAGHKSDVFLATTNSTSGYVWAGGVLLTDMPTPIPAKLGGIDYSAPDHGLIGLHANKGVTFDLDAIRHANPGYRLRQFRAVAGSTGGLVDVRVLVDGQVRFQRRQVNCEHGAFNVLVPIAEKDQFLTLAATDGGDDIGGDWAIFGDPRLEIISVQHRVTE